MRLLLLAAMILGSELSGIAFPHQVWCQRPDNQSGRYFYSFEFTKLPKEIFPPKYKVRVLGEHLAKVSDEPDKATSSLDPQPPNPWRVVEDHILRGVRDYDDAYLIHFSNEHFIRLGKGEGGTTIVSWQLPGDPLPRFEENCLIPQAGVTIHD